ncbi:histidine phosphatase family protein [Fretibacter rubidus]|uniref:SixA phosphatase family protein n=1 Tax=Fretibacter rubidus TaxID=570162 RepID=UPI00352B79C4
MNRRALICASLVALIASCAPAPKSDTPVIGAKAAPSVYYLVRHAEKDLSETANKKDPVLTPAGKDRAKALSKRLSKLSIDGIYSTDYARTRDTAMPLSRATNVPLTLYDASDLASFAAQMKDKNGTFVIVGHSNTTPQLAELLGGEAGEPIVEMGENDRLYILREGERGTIDTTISRYGKPSKY